MNIKMEKVTTKAESVDKKEILKTVGKLLELIGEALQKSACN